jgi:hypothetical protein
VVDGGCCDHGDVNDDDDEDVEDFELLPDGRKVRFTDRALELFDDHDECPFCIGRAAAHLYRLDVAPYTV